MKKTVLITILFSVALALQAQETISKIYLSGFQVNLSMTDKFSYTTDENIEIKKKAGNGMLSLTVVDQTGTIPKSYINLHVNELQSLELHSSKLVMETPLLADTVKVVVADFSSGELNINANVLMIDVDHWSNLSITGKVDRVYCANKYAKSRLNLSQLDVNNVIVDKADTKQHKKGKVELMGVIKAKDTDEPISGITLQLLNPDGGGVDFTEANEQGRFEFRDISKKGVSGMRSNERELVLRVYGDSKYERTTIRFTVYNNEPLELDAIYLSEK